MVSWEVFTQRQQILALPEVFRNAHQHNQVLPHVRHSDDVLVALSNLDLTKATPEEVIKAMDFVYAWTWVYLRCSYCTSRMDKLIVLDTSDEEHQTFICDECLKSAASALANHTQEK